MVTPRVRDGGLPCSLGRILYHDPIEPPASGVGNRGDFHTHVTQFRVPKEDPRWLEQATWGKRPKSFPFQL